MGPMGAALNRAVLENGLTDGGKFVNLTHWSPTGIFLVLISVRG
jgi:hypothetical protein